MYRTRKFLGKYSSEILVEMFDMQWFVVHCRKYDS